MSEHTPGPWAWTTNDDCPELYHLDRTTWTTVLSIRLHEMISHELIISAADKALIAAAPDMLELLTVMIMAPPEQPISAWLGVIEAAIRRARVG